MDGHLYIKPGIWVPLSEIEIKAVRSQGPGGQNVNKVNSAAHLRFDVGASDLSGVSKAKILALSDTRLTSDGVIVIKAQNYRTLEKNQKEALSRLQEMLRDALKVQKKRRPTKPSRGSIKRRLAAKTQRSEKKKRRARPKLDD